MFSSYIEAVQKELREIAGNVAERKLASLFIGGGTPTVLPGKLLVQLISYCQRLFHPDGQVEITVEANPGTIDKKYLQHLFAAGVNRISLGVQSFHDTELQKLGRIHTGNDCRAAIQAAKEVGFQNISLDLMYGLPSQDAESWQATLSQAIAFEPQHLSLYQLTVEDGTPLQQQVKDKKILLPEEDLVVLMDEVTAVACATAGFQQYEISNFTKPGFACCHNINYWQNGDYLGCGASAVSCLRGVREKRLDDPKEYIGRINCGLSVVTESESLSLEASFRESVIMGLRMDGGVSRQRLLDRYGVDLENYYGAILFRLIKQKLVALTAGHLKLTSLGRRFANQIMADLV